MIERGEHFLELDRPLDRLLGLAVGLADHLAGPHAAAGQQGGVDAAASGRGWCCC